MLCIHGCIVDILGLSSSPSSPVTFFKLHNALKKVSFRVEGLQLFSSCFGFLSEARPSPPKLYKP